MIQYDGNDCYDVNIGSIKGKFSEQDILDFVDELIEADCFKLEMCSEHTNCHTTDNSGDVWGEGHNCGYNDGYEEGESHGRNFAENSFKSYKIEMINKLEELLKVAKGY